MKKIWIALLCAALLLSAVGCGKADNQPEPESTAANEQIGNPFIDCETLEDAVKIAGFGIAVPDRIDGYDKEIKIQAIRDEMIQVFYVAEDGSKVLIRKGLGEEDISGDYNHYDNQLVKWVGDQTVNFRGNGDLVYVAYWITEDNAFSFSVSGGMPRETIEAIIPTIQ